MKPFREGRSKHTLPTPPEHSDFVLGFSEDRNAKKRLAMEDSHSFFYDFQDVKNQGFFAIFDGHGGKSAADWCGEHYHEKFDALLRGHPERPVPEVFDMACKEADSHLIGENGIYSGCTIVAALLRDEVREGRCVKALYTANAGDARAVLARNGSAIRLTFDHKGSEPFEQQRVRDAGGFIALDRVNGMLAITRALGDADLKEYVSGRPFTSEVVLDPSSDTCLILACDGLWDVVTDKECIDYIADQEDPAEAAHMLVDFALEQGSTDNISVIVIKFDWGNSDAQGGSAKHPIKNQDREPRALQDNNEDSD